MADTIVLFVIEKLTRLIEKEATLIGGAHDQVKSLRRDLRFMNAFLNLSEGKRKEHAMVEEAVIQIRDVAHEAEDVIDAYVADTIMKKRRSVFRRSVDHALMLRNVALKIEKIMTTLNDILKNTERFGLIEGGRRGDRGEQEAERIRKQRREVEEKQVVGFESYSRVVIDQLRETGSGSDLNVVSIIGIGGLGKTTLARKIYNTDRVKDTFPCRAWGYVSNDYRPREFFLSLLQCLSTDKYNELSNKTQNDEELKMAVRGCLSRSSSKYLVVVDDVWQIEHWNEVKGAFPDDKNGSRILITTRVAEVATHVGPSPPYALPFLNKQKSWELIFKKVFRGQKCPPDLTDLGKSIAESCDGLPLAILVMARILANKSPSEWSKIKDHVNWYLARDKTLKDILKLSYDTLPARLKPCFLYLGMYPKDYRIPVKQLIRLWMSEGLLTQDTSGSTDIPEPEYIAEDYLRKLVDRNLVQVVYKSSDGGGIKSCNIHNALRHLCISESRVDKFFEVCTNTETHTNCPCPCPRRLSLDGTLFDSSSSSISVSGTRSLLCFSQKVSEVNPDKWKWALKSLKLARVLDLGQMNVNSQTLHPDLKKLVHLRYLKIMSPSLETVPDPICMLWNLETLDLRGSPIKSFSAELWQLKQLRHLLVDGPVELPNMPPSTESKTMPNLQTLSTVALDPHTASLLENGTFPGLIKLGLHYEKSDDMSKSWNPREQLQSLHRLSRLQKLKVIGTTEIPQNENAFPSTITKITLTKFSFFDSGAMIMNTLGRLPNLQVLKLTSQKYNNTPRFDLHCADGGFPRLQVLVMVGIKVKSWRLEKGSMPRVRRLFVKNCKFLSEIPRELWSLSDLGQVNVMWPCPELARRLQNLKVKKECKLTLHPSNQRKNLISKKLHVLSYLKEKLNSLD